MRLLNVFKNLSTTIFSIGGQGFFMLANMLVFYVIVQNFTPSEFGVWALFLAIISILDGIRQGLIQNPLIRLLMIHHDKEGEILGTALVLQSGFLIIASLILFLTGDFIASRLDMPDLGGLLSFSFLALFGLSVIQSLSSLALAKNKLFTYFFLNAGYCLAISAALAYLIFVPGLSFEGILLALGLTGVLFSFIGGMMPFFKFGIPNLKWVKPIVDQGKYNSATNLCSLLFQKADIFMIGYFLNPAAVGVFQLATKIIQYVELPLLAFGQTIYPRLAATQRKGNGTHLNFEYARGLFFLFVLTIPGVLAVLAFGENLIEILGNGSYEQALWILLILIPASMIKPWGRVFGLTLESVGLSQINLQMLIFSLGLNMILNLILIQLYGLIGAAIATALSTILTIIIGQLRLRKYVNIASHWGLWNTIKNEVLPSLK